MFKRVFFVAVLLSWFVMGVMRTDCVGQGPDPFPFEHGTDAEKAERLYAYVTGMWAADEIWEQMGVALTNIADGNETGAEAAVDKLLTDFCENQYLPVALHEIAKLYGHFKNYEKGLGLNEYVIEHWPQHEYAMWSGREVAKLNVEQGKMQEAEAAIDNVLVNFADQQFIALVVYEIAEHYRKFREYEKARELYEHILDRWASNWRVVLAQSGLARLYIDSGNEAAAQSAINKLETDFFNVPNAARGIYLVGYHYDQGGRYEKAKPLYEFVASNWPGDWYAMWSWSRLAVIDIGLGEMEAAETAADVLIANYQLTFRIGEAVCDVAQEYEGAGEYLRAAEVYEKVADLWPEFEYAWHAQFMAGRCYEKLKESGAIEGVEADEKIKAAYERVVERYPECQGAKIARRWLSEQAGAE